VAPGDIERVLQAIEVLSDRDSLLMSTLGEAVRTVTVLMGPHDDEWSWGRIHRWGLMHPLSSSRRGAGLPLDIPPLPVGGSDSTVMKAAYRPGDFRVTMGAAVRMVIDVGNWDESVWINSPGQSGDPWSPHYRDLAETWVRGEYVPMVYSRERVDAETELTLTLV
jgi:penicillin amidase